LNANGCTGFLVDGCDIDVDAALSSRTCSANVFLWPHTAAACNYIALPSKIGSNFSVLRACFGASKASARVGFGVGLRSVNSAAPDSVATASAASVSRAIGGTPPPASAKDDAKESHCSLLKK
jgi:hypothetical protein